MSISSTRRQFLHTAAFTAGAAFSPNLLLAQDKPLSKLQVASIGCGGKGRGDVSEIAAGNQIIALCDVDHDRASKAFAAYPEARKFFDYREMFAEMGDEIDVVTVSTPDHMHFSIAVEAMRHGKPLMVQKPLSNNLWETRQLGEFAKQKDILTVMGNQGATMSGTRLLREWIEAGLIGDVTEVHYWTNRPIWPQGPNLEFPEAPLPDTVRWDLWQGSIATDRPYSPKIHPFAWRGFWDYGCGALGDIGCHSFNSAFWALGLTGDFKVAASKVSPFDKDIAPKRSTITFEFPRKNGRPPVKIIWQDGSSDPNTDPDFVRPPGIPEDLELPKQFGQVFVGTEGTIFVPDCYCRSAPRLFPETLREKARLIEKIYPRVKGGPTQELSAAIRGDGPKPISNFEDHAGPLTEMVLAGNLAVRFGKAVDWDSANLKARGLPEADSFIKRPYREGWEPDLT